MLICYNKNHITKFAKNTLMQLNKMH